MIKWPKRSTNMGQRRGIDTQRPKAPLISCVCMIYRNCVSVLISAWRLGNLRIYLPVNILCGFSVCYYVCLASRIQFLYTLIWKTHQMANFYFEHMWITDGKLYVNPARTNPCTVTATNPRWLSIPKCGRGWGKPLADITTHRGGKRGQNWLTRR